MTQALDSATTGGLANTRITAERHIFTGVSNYNPVVVKKGCAYIEDIEIVDANTGVSLIKYVDYDPLDLCSVPTKLSGKEVYSTVLVKKPGVLEVDVSYSYPTEFESSSGVVQALSSLLSTLTGDVRKVWWHHIKDRPVLFNPILHRHDLSKSAGYEHLVNTLDQLIKILILGDEHGHDQIRYYIDIQMQNHYNSLVSEFMDVNNSTNQVLGAINTKLNSNRDAVNSLLIKINSLVTAKTVYQTAFAALPASVTNSQNSANTWTSALAY